MVITYYDKQSGSFVVDKMFRLIYGNIVLDGFYCDTHPRTFVVDNWAGTLEA